LETVPTLLHIVNRSLDTFDIDVAWKKLEGCQLRFKSQKRITWPLTVRQDQISLRFIPLQIKITTKAASQIFIVYLLTRATCRSCFLERRVISIFAVNFSNFFNFTALAMFPRASSVQLPITLLVYSFWPSSYGIAGRVCQRHAINGNNSLNAVVDSQFTREEQTVQLG
jgi:hypothetical protein